MSLKMTYIFTQFIVGDPVHELTVSKFLDIPSQG